MQTLPQEIENQILQKAYELKFQQVMHQVKLRKALVYLQEQYYWNVYEWNFWKKPKVYLGINFTGERLAKKLFDEYEEPYFNSENATEEEIKANLKQYERFYCIKDKQGRERMLRDIEVDC